MDNQQSIYQDYDEWKAFEERSVPYRDFLIRYPESPVVPMDCRAGYYLEFLFMDMAGVWNSSQDESEKEELLKVSVLIRSAALYVPFEKVIFLLFCTSKGQGINAEVFSEDSQIQALQRVCGTAGLIKFLKGFYLRLRNHRHFDDFDLNWQNFSEFRRAVFALKGWKYSAKPHLFQKVLAKLSPLPRFGSRETKLFAGLIHKQVVSAYCRKDFLTNFYAWSGFINSERCEGSTLSTELIKVARLILGASLYLDYYEFDRCVRLYRMFFPTNAEVIHVSESIKELEGCDFIALKQLCHLSVILDFMIHHHRIQERDEP